MKEDQIDFGLKPKYTRYDFRFKRDMPIIKVMLHYVWATKRREPIITPSLKPVLLSHIKENSIGKGIYIDSLNCVRDHIHLLVSLGSEQTVSKVAMMIKGESAHWVNKEGILRHKFEWQDDYYVASVSKSLIEKVQGYIGNQEEHHRKKTFQEEYEDLMRSIKEGGENLG